MAVILHSYDNMSDVPERVKQLVARLQWPLYNAQKLASLPSMTPMALAQLQRIPESTYIDAGSSDDLIEEVSSVANLVLSTSAAIDEVVTRSNGTETRSTISHWYTLLQTIAKHCHQDSTILGDVAFAYPEGFQGESGVATMLVAFSADESLVSLNLDTQGLLGSDNAEPLCMEQHLTIATDQLSLPKSGVEEESHGYDNKDGQDTAEDDTQDQDRSDENSDEGGAGKDESSDEVDEGQDEGQDEGGDDEDEGSNGEDEGSFFAEDSESYDEGSDHPVYTAKPFYYPIPHLDEAELFFGLDLVDEHEPSEEPYLDLPLEAHILAERRTWPSVLFPVLCVASKDDIIPLAASSAYQRRIWGSELPVVALEVSHSGTTVHVHIAWVDPSSDCEHMPEVRILRPSADNFALSSDAMRTQGIFDLRNPQSALEFASFVLSFGSQFDVLRQELPSRRLDKLMWRNDNNNVSWAGNIEDWCSTIWSSDQRSSTDSSEGLSPITPTSELDFTEVVNMNSKHSANPKKSKEPKAANTRKTQSASLAPPPKTVSQTSVTRMSCSDFAKSPAKSVSKKSTIASWMLQRNMTTVTRMPEWARQQPGIADPPDYQQMLDEYENITRFQWPTNWTTPEGIPHVDQCLEGYREELFKEYIEIYNGKAEPLREDLAEIVGSRLSLLFKSVDGARDKERRPNNVRESESRHDFDSLFSTFFVSSVDQVTSSEVFYECMLRLPINTLHEGLKSDKAQGVADALATQLDNWAGHNLENFLRLDAGRESHHVDPDILRQALETRSAIGSLATDYRLLRGLKGDPLDSLRSAVEMHYALEPSTGTCDTLMATAIPLPSQDPKVVNAYNALRLVNANYKGNVRKANEESAKSADLSRLTNDTSSKPRTKVSTIPGASSTGNPQSSQSGDRQSGGSEDNDQSASATASNSDTVIDTPKYDCPLLVHSGNYPPYELDPKSTNTSPTLQCILIPQLTVEFKRPTQKEIKALNQSRMYNGGTGRFLEMLGIKRFPVFTLAVHGVSASLIMGWVAEDGVMYLMERNVQKFNILQPIQAYHLVTVVLRLKARDAKLKELFDRHAQSFQDMLLKGEFQQWAMPEKRTRKTAAATSPPAVSTPARTGTPLTAVHEGSKADGGRRSVTELQHGIANVSIE